jgi:hypothetical protein
MVSSSKSQNVQKHFDISTFKSQTITLFRNVGNRWPGEAASIPEEEKHPLHRCEKPQNSQKY